MENQMVHLKFILAALYELLNSSSWSSAASISWYDPESWISCFSFTLFHANILHKTVFKGLVDCTDKWLKGCTCIIKTTRHGKNKHLEF